MLVLIEYFDNDSLTNIVTMLSLKPDKVIMIYDQDIDRKKSVDQVIRACQVHLPEMQYEMHSVDSDNLDTICTKTKQLVPKDAECIIDLSGGKELMLIAGYRVGKMLNLKMSYADLRENRILNVEDQSVLCPAAIISLDDYLETKGAHVLSGSHQVPKEEDYDRILSMCNIVFRHLDQWKKTCSYLQAAMAGTEDLDLWEGPIEQNKRTLYPDHQLLRLFEREGFIKDLRIDSKISFTFPSQLAKEYLTTFGIWLELYVFIHASRIKGLSNVRLGIVVDWNSNDGIDRAGNEIDVVLSRASRPIFISCKLTEPNAAAINEIVVNTRRIGGNKGRSILVTFSDIKKYKTGTYRRAKEMGVWVLDKGDILRDDFAKVLRQAISRLLKDQSLGS